MSTPQPTAVPFEIIDGCKTYHLQFQMDCALCRAHRDEVLAEQQNRERVMALIYEEYDAGLDTWPEYIQ